MYINQTRMNKIQEKKERCTGVLFKSFNAKSVDIIDDNDHIIKVKFADPPPQIV